ARLAAPSARAPPRATPAPAPCAVNACRFDCPAKYDLVLGCRAFVENPVFDHRGAALPARAPR
ncbi:hypothetical protein KDW08_10375, partial [Burkholderia dolosa]|nr:hypothetical protein [Burkholderia dolosa]